MQIRNSREVPGEVIRIAAVFRKHALEHIAAIRSSAHSRRDTSARAVQPKLGERRAFELIVGVHRHVRRMIDGDQLQLVDIGDLAEFLGDSNPVLAIDGLQR